MRNQREEQSLRTMIKDLLHWVGGGKIEFIGSN